MPHRVVPALPASVIVSVVGSAVAADAALRSMMTATQPAAAATAAPAGGEPSDVNRLMTSPAITTSHGGSPGRQSPSTPASHSADTTRQQDRSHHSTPEASQPPPESQTADGGIEAFLHHHAPQVLVDQRPAVAADPPLSAFARPPAEVSVLEAVLGSRVSTRRRPASRAQANSVTSTTLPTTPAASAAAASTANASISAPASASASTRSMSGGLSTVMQAVATMPWLPLVALSAIATGMLLQLLLPQLFGSSVESQRLVLAVNIVMTYLVVCGGTFWSATFLVRRVSIAPQDCVVGPVPQPTQPSNVSTSSSHNPGRQRRSSFFPGATSPGGHGVMTGPRSGAGPEQRGQRRRSSVLRTVAEFLPKWGEPNPNSNGDNRAARLLAFASSSTNNASSLRNRRLSANAYGNGLLDSLHNAYSSMRGSSQNLSGLLGASEPSQSSMQMPNVEGTALFGALEVAPEETRKKMAFADVPKNNGRIQVLSVDNQPVNQQVMQALLWAYEYDVLEARSGEEALERIAQAEVLPDIVLLDVSLPGMSGFEVCQEIRKSHSNCELPIIMITCSSLEDDVITGLQTGANDYMIKPIRHMELMARIKTQLALKRSVKMAGELRMNAHLLRSILPPNVIKQLKAGVSLIAQFHKEVTILFSDIRGFTNLATDWPTEAIIIMLNSMFSAFDKLCDMHGVYKVETIGDAYMIVCGHDGTPDHAARMMSMAGAMLEAVTAMTGYDGQPLAIRIGVHSGPAHSGVVGLTRPRYCFFGDTVNTASRMESTGFPMAVQVSESTYKILERDQPGAFEFVPCGLRLVKGKGAMSTYLLKTHEYAAALQSLQPLKRPHISRRASRPADPAPAATTSAGSTFPNSAHSSARSSLSGGVPAPLTLPTHSESGGLISHRPHHHHSLSGPSIDPWATSGGGHASMLDNEGGGAGSGGTHPVYLHMASSGLTGGEGAGYRHMTSSGVGSDPHLTGGMTAIDELVPTMMSVLTRGRDNNNRSESERHGSGSLGDSSSKAHLREGGGAVIGRGSSSGLTGDVLLSDACTTASRIHHFRSSSHLNHTSNHLSSAAANLFSSSHLSGTGNHLISSGHAFHPQQTLEVTSSGHLTSAGQNVNGFSSATHAANLAHRSSSGGVAGDAAATLSGGIHGSGRRSPHSRLGGASLPDNAFAGRVSAGNQLLDLEADLRGPHSLDEDESVSGFGESSGYLAFNGTSASFRGGGGGGGGGTSVADGAPTSQNAGSGVGDGSGGSSGAGAAPVLPVVARNMVVLPSFTRAMYRTTTDLLLSQQQPSASDAAALTNASSCPPGTAVDGMRRATSLHTTSATDGHLGTPEVAFFAHHSHSTNSLLQQLQQQPEVSLQQQQKQQQRAGIGGLVFRKSPTGPPLLPFLTDGGLSFSEDLPFSVLASHAAEPYVASANPLFGTLLSSGGFETAAAGAVQGEPSGPVTSTEGFSIVTNPGGSSQQNAQPAAAQAHSKQSIALALNRDMRGMSLDMAPSSRAQTMHQGAAVHDMHLNSAFQYQDASGVSLSATFPFNLASASSDSHAGGGGGGGEREVTALAAAPGSGMPVSSPVRDIPAAAISSAVAGQTLRSISPSRKSSDTFPSSGSPGSAGPLLSLHPRPSTSPPAQQASSLLALHPDQQITPQIMRSRGGSAGTHAFYSLHHMPGSRSPNHSPPGNHQYGSSTSPPRHHQHMMQYSNHYQLPMQHMNTQGSIVFSSASHAGRSSSNVFSAIFNGRSSSSNPTAESASMVISMTTLAQFNHSNTNSVSHHSGAAPTIIIGDSSVVAAAAGGSTGGGCAGGGISGAGGGGSTGNAAVGVRSLSSRFNLGELWPLHSAGSGGSPKVTSPSQLRLQLGAGGGGGSSHTSGSFTSLSFRSKFKLKGKDGSKGTSPDSRSSDVAHGSGSLTRDVPTAGHRPATTNGLTASSRDAAAPSMKTSHSLSKFSDVPYSLGGRPGAGVGGGVAQPKSDEGANVTGRRVSSGPSDLWSSEQAALTGQLEHKLSRSSEGLFDSQLLPLDIEHLTLAAAANKAAVLAALSAAHAHAKKEDGHSGGKVGDLDDRSNHTGASSSAATGCASASGLHTGAHAGILGGITVAQTTTAASGLPGMAGTDPRAFEARGLSICGSLFLRRQDHGLLSPEGSVQNGSDLSEVFPRISVSASQSSAGQHPTPNLRHFASAPNTAQNGGDGDRDAAPIDTAAAPVAPIATQPVHDYNKLRTGQPAPHLAEPQKQQPKAISLSSGQLGHPLPPPASEGSAPQVLASEIREEWVSATADTARIAVGGMSARDNRQSWAAENSSGLDSAAGLEAVWQHAGTHGGSAKHGTDTAKPPPLASHVRTPTLSAEVSGASQGMGSPSDDGSSTALYCMGLNDLLAVAGSMGSPNSSAMATRQGTSGVGSIASERADISLRQGSRVDSWHLRHADSTASTTSTAAPLLPSGSTAATQSVAGVTNNRPATISDPRATAAFFLPQHSIDVNGHIVGSSSSGGHSLYASPQSQPSLQPSQPLQRPPGGSPLRRSLEMTVQARLMSRNLSRQNLNSNASNAEQFSDLSNPQLLLRQAPLGGGGGSGGAGGNTNPRSFFAQHLAHLEGPNNSLATSATSLRQNSGSHCFSAEFAAFGDMPSSRAVSSSYQRRSLDTPGMTNASGSNKTGIMTGFGSSAGDGGGGGCSSGTGGGGSTSNQAVTLAALHGGLPCMGSGGSAYGGGRGGNFASNSFGSTANRSSSRTTRTSPILLDGSNLNTYNNQRSSASHDGAGSTLLDATNMNLNSADWDGALHALSSALRSNGSASRDVNVGADAMSESTSPTTAFGPHTNSPAFALSGQASGPRGAAVAASALSTAGPVGDGGSGGGGAGSPTTTGRLQQLQQAPGSATYFKRSPSPPQLGYTSEVGGPGSAEGGTARSGHLHSGAGSAPDLLAVSTWAGAVPTLQAHATADASAGRGAGQGIVLQPSHADRLFWPALSQVPEADSSVGGSGELQPLDAEDQANAAAEMVLKLSGEIYSFPSASGVAQQLDAFGLPTPGPAGLPWSKEGGKMDSGSGGCNASRECSLLGRTPPGQRPALPLPQAAARRAAAAAAAASRAASGGAPATGVSPAGATATSRPRTFGGYTTADVAAQRLWDASASTHSKPDASSLDAAAVGDVSPSLTVASQPNGARMGSRSPPPKTRSSLCSSPVKRPFSASTLSRGTSGTGPGAAGPPGHGSGDAPLPQPAPGMPASLTALAGTAQYTSAGVVGNSGAAVAELFNARNRLNSRQSMGSSNGYGRTPSGAIVGIPTPTRQSIDSHNANMSARSSASQQILPLGWMGQGGTASAMSAGGASASAADASGLRSSGSSGGAGSHISPSRQRLVASSALYQPLGSDTAADERPHGSISGFAAAGGSAQLPPQRPSLPPSQQQQPQPSGAAEAATVAAVQLQLQQQHQQLQALLVQQQRQLEAQQQLLMQQQLMLEQRSTQQQQQQQHAPPLGGPTHWQQQQMQMHAWAPAPLHNYHHNQQLPPPGYEPLQPVGALGGTGSGGTGFGGTGTGPPQWQLLPTHAPADASLPATTPSGMLGMHQQHLGSKGAPAASMAHTAAFAAAAAPAAVSSAPASNQLPPAAAAATGSNAQPLRQEQPSTSGSQALSPTSLSGTTTHRSSTMASAGGFSSSATASSSATTAASPSSTTKPTSTPSLTAAPSLPIPPSPLPALAAGRSASMELSGAEDSISYLTSYAGEAEDVKVAGRGGYTAGGRMKGRMSVQLPPGHVPAMGTVLSHTSSRNRGFGIGSDGSSGGKMSVVKALQTMFALRPKSS